MPSLSNPVARRAVVIIVVVVVVVVVVIVIVVVVVVVVVVWEEEEEGYEYYDKGRGEGRGGAAQLWVYAADLLAPSNDDDDDGDNNGDGVMGQARLTSIVEEPAWRLLLLPLKLWAHATVFFAINSLRPIGANMRQFFLLAS